MLDAGKSVNVPPKTMQLDRLGSRGSPPDVSELDAVWDLQCLAELIEHCIISKRIMLPADMTDKHLDAC